MLNNWANCKNILCIRADNMGDLLMSSSAIRALKETFESKITILTSSMATGIAKLIPEIDDIITYDLPWVKMEESIQSSQFFELINELKSRNFDAVVVFTVYSQNPLPAVMLAYLAEIPLRLAYCRENPYKLLTHWLPDEEPYSVIKHQVQRDCDLVKTIGAQVSDERMRIVVPNDAWLSASEKLINAGINLDEPWLIVHAGVSELKRQYPAELWIEAAKMILAETRHQILFTGGASEKQLTDKLQSSVGAGSFSIAGTLTLDEFITLIDKSPLVVSVNTGTIHLAAALNTPIVVLYALSNPQHFPWKASGKVLTFDVPEELKSKNEVIRFVDERYFKLPNPMIEPYEIIKAITEILSGNLSVIPELPPEVIIPVGQD